MSKFQAKEPPIHVTSCIDNVRNKGGIAAREISKALEDGSEIKCEKSAHASSSTKNKHMFASWREEACDLVETKGVKESPIACKGIVLSLLKGTPRKSSAQRSSSFVATQVSALTYACSS